MRLQGDWFSELFRSGVKVNFGNGVSDAAPKKPTIPIEDVEREIRERQEAAETRARERSEANARAAAAEAKENAEAARRARERLEAEEQARYEAFRQANAAGGFNGYQQANAGGAPNFGGGTWRPFPGGAGRQRQAPPPPPRPRTPTVVSKPMLEEIVTAGYRALAQKYHPDKGGDPEKMKELNVAVEILRKGIQ